jgi:hypothetical protein
MSQRIPVKSDFRYPFGFSSPSDLTVSIGICSVSTNMHGLCVEVGSEIITLRKTRRLIIEVFWDVPLCRWIVGEGNNDHLERLELLSIPHSARSQDI